jgi:hypothetical protein
MTPAPGRWGAQVANERGRHSGQLPDLAFWPASDGNLQVAVVVIQGQSNPRRERAALEGWRASIAVGQYAQVRYLAGPAAARRLRRLATGLGLTAPQFIARESVIVDEPPIPPAVTENVDEASVAVEAAPVAAPDLPRPSPEHGASQCSTTEEPVETPEQAAEHQKVIDEVLDRGEPARLRRWRRGAV